MTRLQEFKANIYRVLIYNRSRKLPEGVNVSAAELRNMHGPTGVIIDSGGLITSQRPSGGTANSKAKSSRINSPGGRDVLSQGNEEVHFPAKTFSFPSRYAPIASVNSPAFFRSPQFLLLTPSHHKILQREGEEGVNYSSYLSTTPQISEVWVGAVRRRVLAGSTGIKTRFIYHEYFTVR